MTQQGRLAISLTFNLLSAFFFLVLLFLLCCSLDFIFKKRSFLDQTLVFACRCSVMKSELLSNLLPTALCVSVSQYNVFKHGEVRVLSVAERSKSFDSLT